MSMSASPTSDRSFSAAQALVGGRLGPWTIEVSQGRISALRPGMDPESDITLTDGVLAPGLIDLQVNGYAGVDFASADDTSWAAALLAMTRTGVTALLPTIITAPIDDLAASLKAARSRAQDPGTATVLGMHVEGPFISPARLGAHNARHRCDPTPDALDALIEAGGDLLRLVTLAPEIPGGLEAVKRLHDHGVVVSVGHSDASAEHVAAAADAGASMITHLFNAQRPLLARDPGVVGHALADPRYTCGLITDLHHVAPDAIRTAFNAAAGRVAIVTDAVSAAGMPEGEYELGDESIFIAADQPALRASGVIAGSTLRLDHGVRNVISVGIDPAIALEAATRVPADVIGRADMGRIEVGARADLVHLDESWTAHQVWIAGDDVDMR
jgi:N-acetylglucosamine-6-phosphate deacetylase